MYSFKIHFDNCPYLSALAFFQDALEFFLHLIDQVERVNVGRPELDPSRSFKFFIEERLQCPSGKVAYNKRADYILSLNIPLHEATNKGTSSEGPNIVVPAQILTNALILE